MHTVSTRTTTTLTHQTSCTQLQPPGRKVYQRGSYTIWEVDGAHATVRFPHALRLLTSQLYCQNLSLFGKLFIDHKVSCICIQLRSAANDSQSVFFHVGVDCAMI